MVIKHSYENAHFTIAHQIYELFHKLVSKNPFVIQIISFVFIYLHQNCRWIIEIEMDPVWNLSHIFEYKTACLSSYQGVIGCQPAVPSCAGPVSWPFPSATRSETDCVLLALTLRSVRIRLTLPTAHVPAIRPSLIGNKVSCGQHHPLCSG